jgi:integrase
MKGQIRKRGNTYSVIVPLGKDMSGKKRYKWVTCRSKREAEAKRAELVHQANTGMLASPKGTLGEFIERWLIEYARPNLSPRTCEGYQNIYKSHISETIGKVQLKNLKPEHIQKYYFDRLADGLSTTTVRHHAMLLHRVLEHALKWQIVARNPADAVTPPLTRHVEMKTLEEIGIEKVMAEAEKTPYFVLFSLALHTGMRRSELLALRWQDIDLIMAEIYVSRSMHRLLTHETIFRGTKTVKSNRSIALAPSIIAILRQHLDNEMALCARMSIHFTNDRLVFCTWDGKPLIPSSVSQAWRRLTRRLGYDNIRFHDLRHTCATLLLKAGIHPKVVQERLGHSSIAITLDIYSHVTPGMQHQAAEALDTILSKKNSKRIANGISDA